MNTQKEKELRTIVLKLLNFKDKSIILKKENKLERKDVYIKKSITVSKHYSIKPELDSDTNFFETIPFLNKSILL